MGPQAPLRYVPPHFHQLNSKSSDTHTHTHPLDPPDSITIAEFVNNENYGRYPIARARNPFTCGLSGKTYTTEEVLHREDSIARALAERLGYSLNEGTEWDRVVGVFSLNTVRIAISQCARDLFDSLASRSTTSPSPTPFIVSPAS
jgi:hypothetical protein